MKRLILLAVILSTSVSLASETMREGGKLGIGVVLGAPSGFSAKYWLTRNVAYQAYLGGMFRGGLMVGVDYLQHTNATREPDFPFYYGAGAFLGDAGIGGPDIHDKLALGVRAVFGGEYLVRNYPFGIALDLSPSLLLTPEVGMGFEFSVAFRYYL